MCRNDGTAANLRLTARGWAGILVGKRAFGTVAKQPLARSLAWTLSADILMTRGW